METIVWISSRRALFVCYKQQNFIAIICEASNMGHTHFDIQNIRVVKTVRKQSKRDAYASYCQTNSLSLDNGTWMCFLFLTHLCFVVARSPCWCCELQLATKHFNHLCLTPDPEIEFRSDFEVPIFFVL